MEAVVALLIAGALLFAAEVYLPGLIAAKFGFVALISAVALAFVRFGVSGGTWTLVAAVGIVGLGGFAYFRFFGRSPAARRLISRGVSVTPTPVHEKLLNQTGRSVTPLRPGGIAQFGLERVDVVSEGEPVEIDQPVLVIGVEGHRVVVRPV